MKARCSSAWRCVRHIRLRSLDRPINADPRPLSRGCRVRDVSALFDSARPIFSAGSTAFHSRPPGWKLQHTDCREVQPALKARAEVFRDVPGVRPVLDQCADGTQRIVPHQAVCRRGLALRVLRGTPTQPTSRKSDHRELDALLLRASVTPALVRTKPTEILTRLGTQDGHVAVRPLNGVFARSNRSCTTQKYDTTAPVQTPSRLRPLSGCRHPNHQNEELLLLSAEVNLGLQKLAAIPTSTRGINFGGLAPRR